MHAVYSVVFLFINIHAHVVLESYERQRNAILDQEKLFAVGGKLKLTEDEKIANDILMKFKQQEYDESFNNPQHFNFSKHYFSYKNDIEKSKVYQIIKRMPKGAVLHAHSSLMLDPGILVKLTYLDSLYACYEEEGLRMLFSATYPERPCPSEWALVSELRNSSGNVTAFDTQLKHHFTLCKDDEDYNSDIDINTVWKQFEDVYHTIRSLILYRPAREMYWYETLREFYHDNILYIEVRSGLPKLYDLSGTYDRKYTLELYKRVTNKFIEDHPDFIGMKLIFSRRRSIDSDQLLEALDFVRKLKAEMPEMIAGFDLIGQEDVGKPLSDFMPLLTEAKDDIDFFLHAGETSWFGTASDENLIDAILLGAKRIGHGYALTKHPTLLPVVAKRNIALEVNVISNVVLGLVRDVRNHPLATYLAMGLPVVLSSDDPGAWSSTPLSHDFFVAFMGVASRRADLTMLKQLAMNSITYSVLDDADKSKFFDVFNKRWSDFIDEVISMEYSGE